MTSDLAVWVDGWAGRIRLTRAAALNALTHDMVTGIAAALHRWRDDPNIRLVVIDGEGPRAFCAGGDVVGLYAAAQSGGGAGALAFWRAEYALNAQIAAYPKPYVALMSGFVMGGGVGVSAHGSHPVVTDTTRFAMPECSIGLIPDVGGTHLLARMPDAVGLWVGLTGARLDGADCIWAGLARHFVPTDLLPEMVQAMAATGDVGVIDRFACDPGPSGLAARQADLAPLLADAEVGLNLDQALAPIPAPWAQEARRSLQTASPMALALFQQAYFRAKSGGGLERALHHEYRLTSRLFGCGEFTEGIRAALIDKDRAPRWLYPQTADLPPTLFTWIDTPAPDGDLWSALQE